MNRLIGALVLALTMVLAPASAHASKWQGWPSWCLAHPNTHRILCR